MRTHRLLSVELLCLLILIGTGCRDTGVTASATASQAQQSQAAQPAALPNKDGSFKFGVLGDFGTGDRTQYQLVVLVGDNLYGSERPQDFKKKFELPYKPLLDAGVKFYASLGNHDAREQRYYKLFNMEGKLYYTFNPKPDVRFFALESTYPEPEQIKWLENELKVSGSDWKIAFFHHPLYSSGDRHGSDLKLRELLEPLFLKYNVSVVLTGHDHFYERIKPQKGIPYFVVGSGGKLAKGDIERGAGITARGFDGDLVFMAVEIIGDEMYFNAITRAGQVIDSGVIKRRIAT
jgi:hypothetical protein